MLSYKHITTGQLGFISKAEKEETLVNSIEHASELAYQEARELECLYATLVSHL